MADLLGAVIEAHGGLERWRGVRAIDVRLNFSGAALVVKGFPRHLRPSCSIDVRECRVTFQRLGGDPDELPDRYAVADPLCQVPIPAAVRCVHAPADDQVPFTQSVTYVAAARATGQDAQLLEVGGDHFSVADATAPIWPAIIKELEELMGAA